MTVHYGVPWFRKDLATASTSYVNPYDWSETDSVQFSSKILSVDVSSRSGPQRYERTLEFD